MSHSGLVFVHAWFKGWHARRRALFLAILFALVTTMDLSAQTLLDTRSRALRGGNVIAGFNKEEGGVTVHAERINHHLQQVFAFDTTSFHDASRLVADQDSKTQSEATAIVAALWEQDGWPFLQRYCLDCHNEETREGELDLTSLNTLEGVGSESASIQRVMEMVNFGAMPPEDSEQPDVSVRKQFGSLAERILYSVSCDLRPRPGRVTARRLNRAEYDYSVRDLLGIDFDPSKDFPSDEVGAGFDNNGDVLSLSTLLMEKYLDAAEEIASLAIVDPDTLPRLKKDFASDQIFVAGPTQVGRFNGRFFQEEGFSWIEFDVPYTGRYRLRFSGGNSRQEADRSVIDVFGSDGDWFASGEVGYFGGGGSSDSFRFELELSKGRQSLFFVPRSKLVADEIGGDKDSQDRKFSVDDLVTPEVVASARQAIAAPLKPDRSVDEVQFPHMVRNIRIDGPDVFPSDAFPPSHHQVIRKVAYRSGGGWSKVEEAASESLRPLMRRAFRRDVSDEELARYVGLVRTSTNRGMSYYEGMRIALSAVLVSPNFLFRIETPGPEVVRDSDGAVALTSNQLATRLSFFLWSSLPDESLLRLGGSHQLSEEILLKEVDRMLDDQRSQALADQFAEQWFGLRNLNGHEVDADLFPGFSPSLRMAMMEETKRLFMHVLLNDGPISELLTADYSFLNVELASHYGIDVTGIKKAENSELGNGAEGIDETWGDDFRKVSLDGTGRRGLLTHASVLTLTSYPRRTSPVQRGKWILENIFGTPPPDPPAGVPALEDADTATVSLSLREQMEHHRRDPACASCHRVMDQLGFGLEEFDAVGGRRQLGGANAIASEMRGELPGGRQFSGAEELTTILSETETKAFARTAVERLLTFALGRELRPQDRCVVDEIIRKAEPDGYRLRDLVRLVVMSRPFRFYDWESSDMADDLKIQ